MDIKKVIKYSFISIASVVFIILAINTLVIYQIKENNFIKQTISELVSMQEGMNELLKDISAAEKLEILDAKKDEFLRFEKEFEKIEKIFKEKQKDDFADYFIKDIQQDETIKTNLNLLFESEKHIELVFDKVYDLQEEKIALIKEFEDTYPSENEVRKNIDLKIQQTKNYELYKLFSELKYYSKETLYQYKDEKTLQKWLDRIDALYKKFDEDELKKYKIVVTTIGNSAVKIKNIEIIEDKLKDSIDEVINQNKEYSSKIESKIAFLSSEFINFTYFSIFFLLALIFVSIVLLGYKVYKNVGLSVDEIQSKVEDGLVQIKALNDEISNTQKEVVFTMGSIGESRSKETGNHVKRVAEYSKLLALYYGLPQQEAEMLKQASPMHDIGKVAIPDAILNKPGRFDESEREIMNTHAQLGFDMLKHSNRELLKMASIVAYEHHEKWDGSGYPRGLSGEDINIYGRITALADVFDALGSDRCYKKAWDDEKIFNLFKEERAKHFDPKLVDIFFEHLDEFLKIRDSLKDKF